MVGCLVLSHGKVAQAMIDATRGIVGECEQLFTLTVQDLSVREIHKRIAAVIEKHDLQDGLFILVGLPGGSFSNAALHIAREFEKIHVISGVNLSVLISFITKHKKYNFEELGQVMLQDGQRALTML